MVGAKYDSDLTGGILSTCREGNHYNLPWCRKLLPAEVLVLKRGRQQLSGQGLRGRDVASPGGRRVTEDILNLAVQIHKSEKHGLCPAYFKNDGERGQTSKEQILVSPQCH